MKNINRQIKTAVDNRNKLMLGEFNFVPKNILNKTMISDTSKIEQEIKMERIIDVINDKTNDKFYTEHQVGFNYFTLRMENGR